MMKLRHNDNRTGGNEDRRTEEQYGMLKGEYEDRTTGGQYNRWSGVKKDRRTGHMG